MASAQKMKAEAASAMAAAKRSAKAAQKINIGRNISEENGESWQLGVWRQNQWREAAAAAKWLAIGNLAAVGEMAHGWRKMRNQPEGVA